VKAKLLLLFLKYLPCPPVLSTLEKMITVVVLAGTARMGVTGFLWFIAELLEAMGIFLKAVIVMATTG